MAAAAAAPLLPVAAASPAVSEWAVGAVGAVGAAAPPLRLVPLGPQQLAAAASALVTDDVLVLPLFDADTTAALNSSILDVVQFAPEFRAGSAIHVQRMETGPGAGTGDGAALHKDCVKPYQRHTLGSFGGCNLASPDHTELAQRIRAAQHDRMMDLAPYLWNALADSKQPRHAHFTRQGRHIHSGDDEMGGRAMPDRFMVKDPDAKVCGESWHRDCADEGKAGKAAPVAATSGVRFGGWFAAGSAAGRAQGFSCAKGTSLWRLRTGGFAKVATADCAGYEARATRVAVPLGSMVVFDETIVHKVLTSKTTRKPLPTSANRPETRMFLAWEITTNPVPYIPTLQRSLLEGRSLPLKSGQEKRMYPAMFVTSKLLQQYLRNYTASLTDACVQRPATDAEVAANAALPRSQRRKLPTYARPYLVCPSMLEQGLAAPTYSAEALSILLDLYYVPTAALKAARRHMVAVAPVAPVAPVARAKRGGGGGAGGGAGASASASASAFKRARV